VTLARVWPSDIRFAWIDVKLVDALRAET